MQNTWRQWGNHLGSSHIAVEFQNEHMGFALRAVASCVDCDMYVNVWKSFQVFRRLDMKGRQSWGLYASTIVLHNPARSWITGFQGTSFEVSRRASHKTLWLLPQAHLFWQAMRMCWRGLTGVYEEWALSSPSSGPFAILDHRNKLLTLFIRKYLAAKECQYVHVCTYWRVSIHTHKHHTFKNSGSKHDGVRTNMHVIQLQMFVCEKNVSWHKQQILMLKHIPDIRNVVHFVADGCRNHLHATSKFWIPGGNNVIWHDAAKTNEMIHITCTGLCAGTFHML